MMQLSEHFTLSEMVRSANALKYGIKNVPNAQQVENLKLLCINVLEPVRSLVGAPVFVSSGFRCRELNRHKSIGGARNSQHQTGRAADISVKGLTSVQLFEMIVKSDIQFDQIIEEFGDWVHISFSTNPRRSMLIATKINNEVKYTKYTIK